MVSIDPGCFLLWPLLLLILPLNWLLAAFFAALIHELCHVAAVILMGGQVTQLRLGSSGAQIRSELPGRWRRIAATLAGPAGSVFLLLLCRLMPRLAICGFVQGVYNLLPIFPLDGGRALHCLLEECCPRSAEIVILWIESTVALLLFLAALVGVMVYDLGYWPLLVALVPISAVIRRKIPCKRKRIGVQ